MPGPCTREGCKKQAKYGDPKTKKATHCGEHKLEGYVNLYAKRCEHDGCSTTASFGAPTTKKKLTHCAKHRPEGYIDLYNKWCEHDGCSTTAKYGDPQTKKKTHCTKHKPVGHVDLSNKMCAGCNKKQPVYGLDRSKPATHCRSCKSEDMFDVSHSVCVSEHCDTAQPPPGYDGYCTHCFRNLFPLDPRTQSIRAKTREIAVRDFLVERYGDAFVHNQSLFTSCECDHRRSVDFRRIVGGTMLAVEVDEGQHKGQSYRDDAEARYNDLAVAFGGKWVFIRFNPDSYIDAQGRRIKGFFDAKGARRSSEIARRMQALAECIDEQIKRIERDENDELLDEIFLFYDN